MPKIIVKRPNIESIGSIWSIILGILQVEMYPKTNKSSPEHRKDTACALKAARPTIASSHEVTLNSSYCWTYTKRGPYSGFGTNAN